MNKDKKPIVIGNVLPSGYRVGKVYHPGGVSPTVMENHGKRPLVLIKKKRQNERGQENQGVV